MNTNIKSKFNLRGLYSKKTLSVVSLLFMIVIVSSPFVSVYNGVSPFALGADEIVKTATELVNAVDNAPDGESVVISLGQDIALEDTLVIPANKNITLVSDSSTRSYNLIGVDDKSTVTVESDGELVLSGVIVTHPSNAIGAGVCIEEGGKLTMTGGQIFNNTITGNGGGVLNEGYFVLSGGAIFNNTASRGGGVYNNNNFNITGGEIYGNKAANGAGVYNDNGEYFEMSGGRVWNNTATTDGGGICTDGDFILSGGSIFNNTAASGGGVNHGDGFFRMSRGEIANNTAIDGGGIYASSNVTLSNTGLIFKNVASSNGGGVYVAVGSEGIFSMTDGIIANNTAVNGGGMYLQNGNITMTSGKIENNTASNNGGGIGYSSSRSSLERIRVANAAEFLRNRASVAYNITASDIELYNENIGSRVIKSNDFQYLYNNYDIQYTWGTVLEVNNGNETEPSTSPSSTPTSSATPTPTRSATPTPSDHTGISHDTVLIVVAVVIIVVAALVIVGLVFYFPKRNEQQAEQDWIDSMGSSNSSGSDSGRSGNSGNSGGIDFGDDNSDTF
ncbi:MAG: autotransporter adhesin family protein [Candidatus Bathyarchaeota archaeon]|nr:autotransporter adhesin family protein [Candidatus Termiticorpusculum sp.]